jgi:hypothetical protein
MNKYQKNTTCATTPVLPEAVSVVMAELAGDVQEGPAGHGRRDRVAWPR